MLETPSRLHHQLIKFGSQYSEWADIRHLGVMCWMIVGLIGEGSVNLTKWIDYIQHSALQLLRHVLVTKTRQFNDITDRNSLTAAT